MEKKPKLKEVKPKSGWQMARIVIIAIILTSCGSVQSINGISVKKKPDPKRLIVAGAVTFAVGYQVGNQFIQKKK